MIRLRDETSAKSEARALLVGLLHRVDRLPRSAVQRRRVWSALTRPARPSARSQRSVRLVLASALLATAASAGIARYWREPAPIPTLEVSVLGIGLLGPGLSNWATGAPMLGRAQPWQHAPCRTHPRRSQRSVLNIAGCKRETKAAG